MKKFLTIGFVVAVLVACGDDDSDFATRPSGDSSFSSVTPQSSDSETSVSSSSSAKSSSSLVKSSSSVAYVKPCRTDSVDICEYGTLTDERDGQTYKTVTIGTQTWMAENLNFETADCHCYKDSAKYCAKYGRYYTWADAMDSAAFFSDNAKGCGDGKTCTVKTPARGICPEGWHIPDSTEWNTLYSAMGESGYAMQAKGFEEWPNATDAYGFSAFPAGHYSDNFYNVGFSAFFWSASESNSGSAYHWYLFASIASLSNDHGYKDDGIAVRCVKD